MSSLAVQPYFVMRVKLLLLFICSIKVPKQHVTKEAKVPGQLFEFWIYSRYLIEDDLQIPQCVVCIKTFSNSTMKPASLKQHLANAHPSMMSKNRSFFESKLSSLKRQKLDQTEMFWHTNKAAVHESYAIALHVAKTKKTT